MTVRIYGKPNNPLAFDTFINFGDPQQRAWYAALANQENLYMLFYDESLRHQLTKVVNNFGKEEVSGVLKQADELLSAIPRELFDYDKAKAAVMKGMPL